MDEVCQRHIHLDVYRRMATVDGTAINIAHQPTDQSGIVGIGGAGDFYYPLRRAKGHRCASDQAGEPASVSADRARYLHIPQVDTRQQGRRVDRAEETVITVVGRDTQPQIV